MASDIWQLFCEEQIATRSESHIPSAPLFQKLQMLIIFEINIFFKYVFLFTKYIQVKGIFLSISRLTLKQIHWSIPTQPANLQLFILLNFLLAEVNFQ